jgi:hypothetical protein
MQGLASRRDAATLTLPGCAAVDDERLAGDK